MIEVNEVLPNDEIEEVCIDDEEDSYFELLLVGGRIEVTS